MKLRMIGIILMVLSVAGVVAYAYLTAGFGEIVYGPVDGSERTVISKQEQNLWAFSTMGVLFVIGAGTFIRQLILEKGLTASNKKMQDISA